eukprot:gb/GEZN01005842.1/.p1 GENE.gb/GEZN01005842.1/~~gb/GEZN01005842.1/.p1  ORF type:complete len:565 (+),score=69.21 gb/GEZN01005842.1/:56-1696(+)
MFTSIYVQSNPHPRDLLGKFANSDRLAVIDPTSKQTLTWKEYIIMRNKIANALLARGLKPGVKVVLYGLNSATWLVARSAVELIAGIVVPINWHLAPPEIAYILDNCDAEILFCDEDFLFSLEQALVEPEYKDRLKQNLKYCVVMQLEANPPAPIVSARILFSGLVFHPLEELLEASPLFPDVPGVSSCFLYTCGISDKPKAAVRQGNLKAQRQEIERYALLKATDPNQVQLVCAPLYHSVPYDWSSMGQAVGGTMVLMRNFHARQAINLMHRYKVTGAFLPPIALKKLVSQPAAYFKNLNFSSLKSLVVSGAPCPQRIKEETLKVFGPVFYEFYGSSELGVVAILEPAFVTKKPNSCGKRAPGCVVKICDEKGKDLPPGQRGLLYVKLEDQRMMGYYKDQDYHFKQALHPNDSTWVTVGDVAYLDEDDFIFLCDRQIDMIISDGTSIYPAEIEEVLHAHPSIADVAVFGVPDDRTGERVHAAIHLNPTAYSLTVDQVRAFCRGKVADFKIPEEISLISQDFPRTPSGKMAKRKLRDTFWKGRAKL